MTLPEQLAQFITEGSPFGPIATDLVDDPAVLDVLYDQENKIHKHAQSRCPAFIIGRKGAGKTAFLKAPLIDPANRVIELTSFEAFAGMIDLISRLERNNLTLFIEHAADLWENAIWTTILGELTQRPVQSERFAEEYRILHQFLPSFMGESTEEADPISTMARYSQVVAEMLADESSYLPLRTRVERLQRGGVELRAAKQAATNILTGSKTRLFVLMDSMESFHMELNRVQKALAGLFRFIGQHAASRSRCYEVRFCFPTELWHRLHGFSVNPVKDFQSQITLHWHSRELTRIAGQRLHLYLQLYHPELVNETFGSARYDPNRMDHALRLLGAVLPAQVKNKFGQSEEAIPYILRHTQLLPRQLLRLLNRIWERNRRLGGPPHKISPQAVVEGVHNTEDELSADILTAYSAVHPLARTCCERSIPQLPLRFTDGLLHRVFNETGVKKLSGLEFEEFRTAMIEVGAIGRVLQETDHYIVGEFEYTVPHRLFLGRDEDLCLHPLFTRVFASRVTRTKAERQTVKPIYPHGAKLESDDYREE